MTPFVPARLAVPVAPSLARVQVTELPLKRSVVRPVNVSAGVATALRSAFEVGTGSLIWPDFHVAARDGAPSYDGEFWELSSLSFLPGRPTSVPVPKCTKSLLWNGPRSWSLPGNVISWHQPARAPW